MSTLKAGVIGCGFFAQNHLHAWREIEGVDLAAVCDLDEAKAARAAEQFGVPHHYADAGTMLSSERLDFVDIATTMPTHRPLVELAVAHGLPAIA